MSSHFIPQDDNDTEEKGLEAEQEFRKFLDIIQVPYLPISNEIGKFSAALKALLNSKRPDVLLLLGKAGMLPVDVKYKSDERDFSSYLLDCTDIERYLNFSDAFGIDVWYAISNRQLMYATWYWLAINDVKRLKFRRKGTSRGECYVAPKKDLITVSAKLEKPLAGVLCRLAMPSSR